MASDSCRALTKRSSSTTLMGPPPPPPKRIKRPAKVLDEDTYTNALDHIIKRDFFPGLLETETQHEYLDAISSRDSQWIAEAERKLTEVMTPRPDGRRGRRGVSMTPARAMESAGETPRGWTGDTPRTQVDEGGKTGEAAEKDKKPHLNMSLGEFQATYTSEDNESFNAVLDRENEKKRKQNGYLWAGNRIPSKRQLAWHAARSSQEEDENAIEAQHNNLIKPSSSTTTTLIRTTHAPDPRPASLTHRPSSTPTNAILFPPSSIEHTHPTTLDAALSRSLMPPKRTIYTNTRLAPDPLHPSSIPPASPSLSAIDAAIARRPRPSLSLPGSSGAETPRVNGYAFVDAEPESELTPEPDSRSASALLARLGPADSTPNPFSIQRVSRREDLHHRLVDRRAALHKRGVLGVVGGGGGGGGGGMSSGGRDDGNTPRFASSPVQHGSLTPAARRLLERVGTPKRGVGFGGGAGGGEEKGERAWVRTRTPVGGTPRGVLRGRGKG
ncbi:hypothetical protein EJ05DRAFT_541082 [Pseudovirgaria hyperparasitica]|uniref:Nuclear protein DGCR14 n=1 Tax=Pseudovirgaria hyperparasitica TaxID=470096 RepID=A0A6A6VXR8_9PEZI|nr:uncharacterized protein EJ05DRAFT_541082 [Pseudovirgaria hyperparasitica]KAF2754484.1 hypothetical protein EJ05DRAFT_541082 [Pseudovirgaria hyperparasitica]